MNRFSTVSIAEVNFISCAGRHLDGFAESITTDILGGASPGGIKN